MSQLPEPLDSAWIKPKHFDDHSWRKYIWYTHGNGNGNVNGWGWVEFTWVGEWSAYHI